MADNEKTFVVKVRIKIHQEAIASRFISLAFSLPK